MNKTIQKRVMEVVKAQIKKALELVKNIVNKIV